MLKLKRLAFPMKFNENLLLNIKLDLLDCYYLLCFFGGGRLPQHELFCDTPAGAGACQNRVYVTQTGAGACQETGGAAPSPRGAAQRRARNQDGSKLAPR